MAIWNFWKKYMDEDNDPCPTEELVKKFEEDRAKRYNDVLQKYYEISVSYTPEYKQKQSEDRKEFKKSDLAHWCYDSGIHFRLVDKNYPYWLGRPKQYGMQVTPYHKIVFNRECDIKEFRQYLAYEKRRESEMKQLKEEVKKEV